MFLRRSFSSELDWYRLPFDESSTDATHQPATTADPQVISLSVAGSRRSYFFLWPTALFYGRRCCVAGSAPLAVGRRAVVPLAISEMTSVTHPAPSDQQTAVG